MNDKYTSYYRKDSQAKGQLKPRRFSPALYFSRHLQGLLLSAGRLWRTPFSTFLTVAVIAIALALPSGLYVLLQNAKNVGAGFDNGTQLSLFLKMNTDEAKATELLNTIRSRQDVARANYISPEQGLKELQQQANYGDVLQQLPKNPLPGVIEVKPVMALSQPYQIEQLQNELRELPQVDTAVLDMQWLMRLRAIIQIGQRGTYALTLLLCLGVILVIGNTIRLATQNAHEEIEVTKLVGATNAFIRRPFLYTGILYGAAGALFAVVLNEFVFWWLSSPVRQLTDLYQSHYHLQMMSLGTASFIIIIGGVLGLLGAWVTVNRQIAQIEPGA